MNLFYDTAYAGTLFTLPDATSTLAQVGAYSSPIFSDLFPLVALIVGVLLATLVVKLLIGSLHHRG
jgi:hypothetical protein